MPPDTALSNTDVSCQPGAILDHCRALGLFCWRFGPDAQPMDRPEVGGLIGGWLRSPGLEPYLTRVVRGWLGAGTPRAVEAFPGCWLLPVPGDAAGTPSGGVAVAMALGQCVLESEQFEAICAAAALDKKRLREAMSDAVSFRSSEVARLEKTLAWCQNTSAQRELDRRAIDEFSERLIQSYEEVNLLFKLTRYLNSISQPAEMMQAAIHQILEITPLEWVAVVFKDTSLATQSLAGKLILAGPWPCGRDEFREAAVALMARNNLDNWTCLLQPDRSEFAALVGADIVFDPIAHDNIAIGGLLAGYKKGAGIEVSSAETQILDATADMLGMFHENISRFEEQQTNFIGTLRALTAAIDAKDTYTRGHSDRVALYAVKLAQAVGMKPQEVERVRVAGLIHDVGKIGIPEAVLCKSGRLTVEEFNEIKKHPEIGYTILKDIPSFQDVLPGVLHHHERWEGGGYPHGMSGEKIPLLGRLLALADTYDAMSSDRSYRTARTRDQVIAEITRCSGTQFDPKLAEVFVTLDLSE